MNTSTYLRLRQICLVAPDLAKAEEDIHAVLNVSPCYHDANVGKYGLENALFPLGDSVLEVVVPMRDGTAAGRFLSKSGGRGGYMVIMDCSDIDRRRAHVEALGLRIINTLDYDGFRAIQMHPRDCRAAILEFNNTAGGEATTGPYHPAGPGWPEAASGPCVAQLLDVEVESTDPAGLAAHWGGIIERPVEDEGGRPVLRLDAGRVTFRRCEAGERLAALHIEVEDPGRAMMAARERGLVDRSGTLWLYGVRVQLQAQSRAAR